MDASSTSGDFIWAVGGGSEMRWDDPEESIQQHSSKGTFALNLVSATGGDGAVNPFAGRPPPTTTEGGEETSSPMSKADRLIIAHGMLAALLAFSFLPYFP